MSVDEDQVKKKKGDGKSKIDRRGLLLLSIYIAIMSHLRAVVTVSRPSLMFA